MADASIPVDLLNPGQVFACLGLLEATITLTGDAQGAFSWYTPTTTCFHLRSSGPENPVAVVLGFLSHATVSSIAPGGSAHDTKKWQIPTVALPLGTAFPFPDPASPATLPALLQHDGKTLQIDHWGESAVHTRRDAVKFWAGSGGYPGAALLVDALNLVRDRMPDAVANPFALSAPQSSSFRFDWRRDYVPMDVGFSPNDHGEVVMAGFPLVEILAAIGLSNARPKRIDKLTYRYGVVAAASENQLLDPVFLRAALGNAELPFPQRRFRMQLDWPGQENQARCITDVFEEIPV